MTPSSSALLTNVLLTVIAALLLVLVIQNGNYSGSNSANYTSPQIFVPRTESVAPSQPSENYSETNSAPQPAMGNNMIFLALKAFPQGCEGKKVLAECSSPQAQAIKQELLKMEESGQGPKQIFDYIVKKWGEGVLTDQALQIRKMRSAKH